MDKNIEIKARVVNLEALRARARQLSDGPGVIILQEDIFFEVPQGRLKLRKLAPDMGQLIYYERDNRAGPKASDYVITPTSDPDGLREVLGRAWGVRGIVRKRRELYMVGNTRVHLDDVEGLGAFMELEVVLAPEQTDEQGEEMAFALMAQLGIMQRDLVDVAYIDLLEQTESF